MSNDYVIETNHISCKSGYKYLIKDISWNVKVGEHWVVFGMNGSGKTTLLSIIAGFKHFTSGDIRILGQDLSNESLLNIRKRIGWVSASFFDKYYSKESVMDIILSGRTGTLCFEGYASLEERNYAQNILKELGLSDRKNYTFDMLSKGERQNVLIARALYANPDVLILDEPCTGLDIYNREYLFQALEVLAEKKNLTIIYVTHYVEEITPLFDHVLLMKNGHIFASGKTKKLFTDEILTEFLDYPVKLVWDNGKNMKLNVLSLQSNLETIL